MTDTGAAQTEAPTGRPGRRSLRSLVIGGALIAALVPTAVIGIGSWIAVKGLVATRATEQSALLASVLAERYAAFLDARKRGIAALARDIAADGRIDLSTVRSRMQRLAEQFPAFADSVSITNSTGQAVAMLAAAADPSRLNFGDRAWFRLARDTREAIVDPDVILSRRTGKPVIVVAAPIVDANGDVLGVASGGLQLSVLQETVERFRYGRTATITVTTGKGTVLAAENQALVADGFDYSTLPVWGDVAERSSGQLADYAGPDGEHRSGGFATVGDVGWKVWVSQDEDEILERVVEAYRAVAVWAIGAVVVAVALAVAITGMITRPIEALRSAAVGVSKGNLDRRAPESGPYEIVELSRAVNAMSATLRTRIEAERGLKGELEASVRHFASVAARVGDGDLTARTGSRGDGDLDRLGASLDAMIDALGGLVDEIRGASGGLASASAEILAATKQQVAATQEESTAVKQTAVTVAEVKQTAELVSSRAQAMAALTKRAAEISSDGRRSIEETVAGSEKAKATMEGIAQRILDLSEQVQSVAEINATVNDLAEQSNLLAVNAEIEAAKAGEAGRGFAVVATEVKSLAEQCKEATAQVRGILRDIQRATQAAMLAAEQGVKTAESGAAVSSRSDEAIRALEQTVRDGSNAAQQILASTQQQTVGMDQITQAMENIQDSSAQTVSATTQVEETARQLTEMAQRLTTLVDRIASADRRRSVAG